MKRLISTALIGLLACGAAFGLATQKTNSVNLVLANVCDGTFNDFKFQLSGYDDQAFVFNYDKTLTGVAATFRITKPIDGTIYLDVPITSITVGTTNATFSIARTNIPPPGSYYGELLSYEADSTNYYRSIAQGKLPVTWSLYLNESNFFARATTNAGVGQVYVHPNWIDPPWLSSTSDVGTVYVTLTAYNAHNVLQANTNTVFQSFKDAQIASNATYSAFIASQIASNTALQSSITLNLANQAATNTIFRAFDTAQIATNAALLAAINVGGTGSVSLVTYNAGITAQANTNTVFETGKVSVVTYAAGLVTEAATNAALQGSIDAINITASNTVRYAALTNANENVEVLASGTGITVTRTNTTINVAIPTNVKLHSMMLRWNGVSLGSTFNLITGTADMSNTTIANRWGAIGQFYREDTGALIAGASVRLDTANFNTLVIQGLPTASITHCRFSF